MLRFLIVLCCLLPAAGSLPAQTKEPPPTQLELTPAKPPLPSLRFNLLPELREQTPGNAAPLYRKAGDLIRQTPADNAEHVKLYDAISAWFKLPLAELPREELSKVVALYKEPLDLLRQATRCESCDFEVAQRQREKGISASLEDLQKMRMVAMVLGVKVRLELLEDRPDKALRTLQMMYTLGRRVGNEPTLIASLIGIALTAIANQALEVALTHPKTPNLSWSLATLPYPFMDMRRPFEGERLWVYGTFPGLLDVSNNLEAGPLPQEMIAKWMANLELLEGGGGLKMVTRTALAVQVRARHETAKKALIAQGRPAEVVEKWPHMQVAVMHALLQYDQHFDELLKWQAQPHWQAAEHLEVYQKQLKNLPLFGPDSPAIPLARFLLPAVQKVLLARERLERQFAALRHIEALRLYAADHGGKLPERLSDIKEVPLPVCPVTGKDFEYRLEGEKALLSAPPVPPSAAGVQPLRYEITLRKGEVKP